MNHFDESIKKLANFMERIESPIIDTIVGGTLCKSKYVFTQKLGGRVYYYPRYLKFTASKVKLHEGDILVFHAPTISEFYVLK